jgi:hypothetical protein
MTKTNKVAVNRPPTYANGFAPRDGQPRYPELWRRCVGAWNPGLGPSGLTLRDWSKFGNHGTLTNGPTWVASVGRYAVGLDGTNDYVVAPRKAQIVAMSLWVFVTGVTGDRRLFSINTNAFSMYVPPNSYLLQSVYNNSDAFSFITLKQSEWNHVCASFDGSVLKCYHNGVERSSRSVAAATLSTAPIYFGSLDTSFNIQYWNGYMDDMMAFDFPVSAKHAALLASRRGIAYELAPRKRTYSISAPPGGFQPYWATQRSQMIGGGVR